MSSTVSTSSTLGNQIDVTTLVSQLMSTEQQPIVNLQNQQANCQSLISAYGTVQSAMSTFGSAMSGLTNLTQFQGMTASSSNSSAVTASASSSLSPGSYTVSVSSLAQTQTLVASGVASQSTAIGAGGETTLSFDFGTITGNTLNSTTNQYGSTLSNAAVAADGKTVTVTSTSNLAVGATITGDGFPAGTTIASITNGTTFVTSNADTNTAAVTGLTLQASPTFAANGSGTKTVTIDSSNNTLQGIASAINSANIGVTASIINDGSSTPYRLTLTSTATGASNSMKISVAGDTALNSLLGEDPTSSTGQSMTQTAAAQSANFTVNGIAVSKPTNTVTDVVPGLTLNLLQTTTTPLTVSVAQNTSTTSSSISSFVSAYNALQTVITNVTSYNATTKVGAVLQGDFAVNTLNSQLHEMLNTPVQGAGSLSTLQDVGITFQTNGQMSLDSSKLNTVLSSNFNNVAALFDTVGQATDPQITYSSAASTTQAGNYNVAVSQNATQGSLVGSAAAGTTITSSNNILNIALNGTNAPITLTQGEYTAATLATEIQNEINGSSQLVAAGAAVTVTQNNGIFSIVSNKYGSASTIALSGNGASNLMGSAPVATTGLDVEGSIGGVAATGSGQYLTAAGGNALGLKIQVAGGAIGSRGSVDYSQGYAGIMNLWASSQNASTGLLSSSVTGQNNIVTSLGTQITQEQTRLSMLQTSYTKQYTALDLSLASMASTSTYLTEQLAAIKAAAN